MHIIIVDFVVIITSILSIHAIVQTVARHVAAIGRCSGSTLVLQRLQQIIFFIPLCSIPSATYLATALQKHILRLLQKVEPSSTFRVLPSEFYLLQRLQQLLSQRF